MNNISHSEIIITILKIFISTFAGRDLFCRFVAVIILYFLNYEINAFLCLDGRVGVGRSAVFL